MDYSLALIVVLVAVPFSLIPNQVVPEMGLWTYQDVHLMLQYSFSQPVMDGPLMQGMITVSMTNFWVNSPNLPVTIIASFGLLEA